MIEAKWAKVIRNRDSGERLGSWVDDSLSALTQEVADQETAPSDAKMHTSWSITTEDMKFNKNNIISK